MVVEFRHVQEPAPIPLHPAVVQHVPSKSWDLISNPGNVIPRNAVSVISLLLNSDDGSNDYSDDDALDDDGGHGDVSVVNVRVAVMMMVMMMILVTSAT